MTPSVVPTQRTWIIRFKHHKTTVLLHVDGQQKLSSVRAELLQAIQQTHPDKVMNGHASPQNPDDILLARPADANDLNAGWESLEDEQNLAGLVAEESGKGKGKAVATTGKSKQGTSTDSLQSIGLKDGGVVAFKFRSDKDADKKDAMDEGVDVGDEAEKLDGETLVGEAAETWDVVIPSMEETYAEGEATEGLQRLEKLPEEAERMLAVIVPTDYFNDAG